MPTPRKAGRFGGSAAHHNRMMANLATELIRHGRIRTTHAKAKAVQPLADRMITFGKRGDLHARRLAGRVVRDGDVLHHLFADVGPAFAERDGGYTRVLKLGPRKGDAAPMALLELVEDVAPAERAESAGGEGRRWGLRRRDTAAPASAAPASAAPAQTATAAPPAAAEIPEPTPEATAEETPEVAPDAVEARLSEDAGDVEDAAPAAPDEPEAAAEADGDADGQERNA